MTASSTSTMFAAALLSAGLSLAGFFVSQTIYNAKTAVNTAEVKGLSIQRVEADLAYWTIGVSVSGSAQETRTSLYGRTEDQQRAIARVLGEQGFEKHEIELGTIDYNRYVYRNDKHEVVETTQHMSAEVRVETPKVRAVKTARGALNKLVAEGFDLDNQEPSYLFTSLNEIKPEMLQEATTNARVAATQFAEDAGVKVGSIRAARQGMFSITDVGSSYGDSRKIEKEVRVITHIEFYLIE